MPYSETVESCSDNPSQSSSYQKAADLGDADAMYNLARCYKNGNGVAKDMKKATELYQKAADKGNADAMYNLALCYQKGEGVKQNLNKAVELYQQAADKGHTKSMYNLALMYYKGNGVTKDKKKAAEFFEGAAVLGHAGAMKNLATMYHTGDGVPKNIPTAIQFYEEAIEKGNATAMFNLAFIYYQGNGVPKNMKKAAELFKQAADKGNVGAMVNLGYIYQYADGIAKDEKTAAGYYFEAALRYQNGSGVAKSTKKAIELYQQAADFGNAGAMNNLAICYEKGDGVAQDMKKAIELYGRAFDLGNAYARKNLVRCYANGIGVAPKYDKNDLDPVIKLALASCCYSSYYINNFKQWNTYTENIKTFIQEKFGEFNTDYTLEFKKCGSDLGLTIISKPYNKKYFLKIYPYKEETYKEKLTEIEIFRLLGAENSMKVFNLYTNKENGCIIFCSEQALTGEIKLFPKFVFKQIKKELEQPKTELEQTKTEEEQKEKKEEDTETREVILEKEQPKTLLENNREFKNLCQFFKIMIYSAMFNLADVRDTNVLMALEEQDKDKNKDIRIKLIDFWLGRHGNKKSLPDEIKLIDRDNGQEQETIMKNPFLPKNNLTDSPSQIFLKQCIYLFLLAQSRENFGTIITPTSQGVCNITKDVLKFIQENSEISQILEEKVLGYIEEVFGKIEKLGKEIETISGQPLSGQTTAVSSTTPPLPVQPSCDDTTKSPETPEQSREDLKTLLEVKVQILNQFCERYQYIQEQLGKFSQPKTADKPTEEVKLLPEAEQQSLEAPKDTKPTSESEQEFTNLTHSVPPTSYVAVVAAAPGYANIIDNLAARQKRLKLMQEKIAIIQKRLGGKSQISTLKSTASQSIVMTA